MYLLFVGDAWKRSCVPCARRESTPTLVLLSERANLKVQGDQTYFYFAHRATYKNSSSSPHVQCVSKGRVKGKDPDVVKIYIKNQWQRLFSIFERKKKKKSSISLRRDNLSPNAGGSFPAFGYNCGPGGCCWYTQDTDVILFRIIIREGKKAINSADCFRCYSNWKVSSCFRDKKRLRVAPFVLFFTRVKDVVFNPPWFPTDSDVLPFWANTKFQPDVDERRRRKVWNGRRRQRSTEVRTIWKSHRQFFFCGRPHFLRRRLFTTMNF